MNNSCILLLLLCSCFGNNREDNCRNAENNRCFSQTGSDCGWGGKVVSSCDNVASAAVPEASSCGNEASSRDNAVCSNNEASSCANVASSHEVVEENCDCDNVIGFNNPGTFGNGRNDFGYHNTGYGQNNMGGGYNNQGYGGNHAGWGNPAPYRQGGPAAPHRNDCGCDRCRSNMAPPPWVRGADTCGPKE